MAYYQITYATKEGKEYDDYLLEKDNIKDARDYAEHRIDGSYGQTDFVSCKVKRISSYKAAELCDQNAVCWLNNGIY